MVTACVTSTLGSRWHIWEVSGWEGRKWMPEISWGFFLLQQQSLFPSACLLQHPASSWHGCLLSLL